MEDKDTAMNTERDLREHEKILQPSWHLPLEHQLQPVSQQTFFPDDNESMQDRNMEYISSTNQPYAEDLASQASETEVDAELSLIADQLRETASYAINPIFKEELRKKLLQQFVAHHTAETKPEERQSLEQAFQVEGLQLQDGAPHSYEDDCKHKSLLHWASKHIVHLFKRFQGQTMKKPQAFPS